MDKLATYRSMRNFTKTAEPSGEAGSDHGGMSFVIQQHAARRMHYDFRLELDGVLLSWSVPKGPSLSPSEKRLAVRTEDHPLDYANFEGIIPKGQYGGGTVSVWDRGTWVPEGDPHESMRKGHLTFALEGKKLQGRWHLIRTKGGDAKHDNWLLFKSRDEAANENDDIVAKRPESVITGRTLEQIASDADRVWHSNRADKNSRNTVSRNVGIANEMMMKLPKSERTTKRGADDKLPKSERTTKRGADDKLPKSERTAKRGADDKLPKSERTAKRGTDDDVAALVSQLPLGFELTNLDKILYPEQGITKAQLIAYFAVVADWMLPHVGNRPLTLVRCPEGRTRPCFFQKKMYPGAPKAVHPVKIEEESGATVDYMRIRDMPGLVGLAQLGTLEIHTWGCHADKVERPDFLLFDLDPDEGLAWDKVALAALDFRRRLHDRGLESWVKTTGGKGLHVCLPVQRKLDWDDFKAWSKDFAEDIANEQPERYTLNMAKRARKGKIFVDYLRNGRNATFICAYSPRAREGAPVSTPISWEELAHGVDPAAFTIQTVPSRLAHLKRDPWANIYHVKQTLPNM